ncbi:hypothetical protein D3C71_1773350 [compost metagenome]
MDLLRAEACNSASSPENWACRGSELAGDKVCSSSSIRCRYGRISDLCHSANLGRYMSWAHGARSKSVRWETGTDQGIWLLSTDRTGAGWTKWIQ